MPAAVRPGSTSPRVSQDRTLKSRFHLEGRKLVEQQRKPALQFAGTKRERELAEKVMGLIMARGMFMSANAPIRIPLGSLAEFLDSQGEKDSLARIDALVTANPDIFVIEDGEGEQFL